ncbi:MAG: alpha-2-macroglobulin [Pseudomonadota bacterium]
MRLLARALASLLVLCLALPATAAERTFAHSGIAKDAERYETYLKSNWKPGKAKPAELVAAGAKALAQDARLAARNYAMAVVAEEGNTRAWIGLARALLAIQPDPTKGSERYDLPVNASGSAYLAYLRAKDVATKAEALVVLSEALRKRSYWRPAIEALKTSLALVDDSTAREALDKLTAEHGFRMTDYKTDSDAERPRLCAQFSEPLARGQVDFAKFVSVGGKDPESVTPEDKQLCIEGLAHGQRYEIQIRSGLPSAVGETLQRTATLAVYVPDRKPLVRFTGRAYVLPSRGQQGIPLVSVNTDAVAVEIYRIGDRNLVGAIEQGELQRQLSSWDVETLKSRSGERVYEGRLEVKSRLNEDVTTAFPLSDAVKELKPGAYAMIARPAKAGGGEGDGDGTLATQWFIVSDLGLTALSGTDGVHAFVRSLADARPVTGASVRLVARNNEVLATASTDAAGYVRFDAGLSRGEGGLQPALLVAERNGGEYAFLDLTAAAFDLSDRGVKGREAPGPIDGYLWTERGVYRPGEDVHFAALARDAAGKAASVPTTLVVTRPDGVEHRSYTLADQGLGGRAVSMSLGTGVMTGTWRASLATSAKDEPFARVSFLVEDFVPERIDMSLEAIDKELRPELPARIKAVGRYLYGPPAAELGLEGEIIVKASTRDVEGYPGYRFGLADETITPVRESIPELPDTDAEGKAELSVMLPAIPKTARPLEAELIVKLQESGGRTIQRSLTLPVAAGGARIGIKPLFDVGALGEDRPADFDVVSLDGSGRQLTVKGVEWQLSRLDTSWQWYSRDGSWNFEAVTIPRRVAAGTLDLEAGKPARISAPVTYGRYRLEVASGGAEGAMTTVVFNAGWVVGEDTADSPEALDVALDKATYKAGETAKLRIASKHAGKALVAVLGSSVHHVQEVDIAKGGGDVPVTVSGDWGPGAYVTAILYRAMDEAAKRMPTRAIGVRWLALDAEPRTLGVKIGAPDKIASGAMLDVPVRITGLTPGEDARVTVAAVDVGILNMTRFKSPAPDAWFNAQRRLGLEIRDFYGRLIDGMRAERGTLRSGGDGDEGMTADGAPPVEETVALFSGITKVGADGTAKVSFALPDFNGSVRLMAVAWSRAKVGHADREVIVRDPIALTASGPRFITLGDELRLELAMHNIEGPGALYEASLTDAAPTGAAKPLATRAVQLDAGKRKVEWISLKPRDVGLQTLDVAVKGPDGILVKRRLTYDVKPPAGDVRRTTVAKLPGKGGKLTLGADLVHDLIASRTRIDLAIGPMARLDVPGLLAQLDRYPYGCAEQTVSRALPLLYSNLVASRIGLGTDKELKARVEKAIDRVMEMQDGSGAFGAWGPASEDVWLTSYVTDFLTRAKETGYAVPAGRLGQALDRLQNFVSYAQDFDKGGEDRAYALYVLARNGRAPIGELRYYVDTRLDRFASPLAKAQLGAALAMMADRERAERAFRAAMAELDKQPVEVARADYGSSIRDGAALVTLAAETGIAKGDTPRLVDVVAKAYGARTYTSTQEQAWLLMAAKALGDESAATRVSVAGKRVEGAKALSLSVAELQAGAIEIVNDGDEPTDVVVSVLGAAMTPEPAIAKGFAIERSYYTLDGKKLDLASATGGTSEIRQNERMVVVLKIDSREAGGRVLLVDRLPAGLEIENPRLVDSGDISSLSWLTSALKPEHTEFRDDRFVAAFNLFAEKPAIGNGGQPPAAPVGSATVAYIVRAVTPGSFVHPAATVEDMYRPERHARSAAGRLTVKAVK